MKRLVLLIVGMALAVAPVVAQDAAKPKAVDITGSWEMTVESPQGTMVITANFKQEGETLTGTHVSEMGEAPLKGTVKGADVEYTLTLDMGGQQMSIAFGFAASCATTGATAIATPRTSNNSLFMGFSLSMDGVLAGPIGTSGTL